MSDTCPNGCDLRGEPIPNREGFFYKRALMHEIRGVYDGGLYYSCPDCGIAWHRWTSPGMMARAQPSIDAHNAVKAAEVGGF